MTTSKRTRLNRSLAVVFGLAASTPLSALAQDAEAKSEPAEQPEVQFDSDSEGVRFHVLAQETTGTVSGPMWSSKGSGHFFGRVNLETYEEVCSAPCTRNLVRNSYTFGLSQDGGKPIRAETPVDVDGPVRVSGSYRSYAAMRTAGVATIIVSGVAGLAMVLSAGNDCDPMDSACEPFDSTMLFGGAAVGVGGGLIGLLLALKNDEAEVQIMPIDTAGKPRRVASGGAARKMVSVPIFAARF